MDDQAETVAMRLARAEGRGSAGMACATLFEDRIWILRPLLSMRREALRDVLRSIDQAWIDDPSNEREASERVRVRRALADKPGEVERLARAAAEAGKTRRAEALAATRWLEKAEPAGPGTVRLPKGAFDVGSALLPMRALLAAIGGTPHLPSEDATAALIGRLRAEESGTISRTLVKRNRDGFVLSREKRGVRAEPAEVTAAEPPPPLAPPRRGEGSSETSPLPSPVRGGVRGGGRDERGSVAPWVTFLPGFDIPLRNAVARLLGIPPVPESPA
jgi:tRNA(Ile)-lysidine synthase